MKAKQWAAIDIKYNKPIFTINLKGECFLYKFISPKLTSWWLLELINKYTNSCWANLVSWKINYGGDWEDIFSDDCLGTDCYCGKYKKENC